MSRRQAITTAWRLAHHQKPCVLRTAVQRLVRFPRHYLQSHSGQQAMLHTFDLHRQFARQHVEKLARPLVPMALLR